MNAGEQRRSDLVAILLVWGRGKWISPFLLSSLQRPALDPGHSVFRLLKFSTYCHYHPECTRAHPTKKDPDHLPELAVQATHTQESERSATQCCSAVWSHPRKAPSHRNKFWSWSAFFWRMRSSQTITTLHWCSATMPKLP